MADVENVSLSFILSSLKLHKRLEREKGLNGLQTLIDSDSLTLDDYNAFETSLSSILSSPNSVWEELHGVLMAANLLIEKKKASQEFKKNLMKQTSVLLENEESRIRLITGELVGHLCQSDGVSVYEELQDGLLTGIRSNIERNDSTDGGNDTNSMELLHDTAGWKCLETYMSALQHAVEGCGFTFGPLITAELFDLLFSTFKHTNRFVRETGYKVIASIVKCPGLSVETKDKYWTLVAIQLAEGLSDNWSQVRMSASVATRHFLTPIDILVDSTYLPHLLPPMCLNRYYVAEGVRLYSQETWRLVTKGQGIQLVEKYIDNVVSFYIKESEASNHAVREAACACIAELGTKVSQESVKPQVPKLVGALLDCFRDESWPVRDAACLACGNFVSSFPEDCRSYLPDLLPLFLGNLEDSIPSVRQGGAVAISCLVKTYGDDIKTNVIDIIKERLPLVAQQPAASNDTNTTSLHPGVESGPAVFGVVKRVHDNDIETHSNQQMYSCGSLAPKMKRGGGGGCMHSDFHKPAQPWEKSEGCIHLIAELSQLDSCHGNIKPLLPQLAEASKHRHYIQHYNYLESLMKQLPVIAKALGKRSFKQYLEQFFDGIFYGLSSSSSPQLKMASTECLQSLTVLIGPAIMRGRVEQYNPSYLNYLT